MSALRRVGNDYGAVDRSKTEFSTAQKFYDLEESQKKYQELLQENVWLKQQIERSRVQPQDISSSGYCRNCCDCSNEMQAPELSHNGDLTLWSMMERNRYLQNKIDKLRNQYDKQSRTISSIKNSDKWRNRFVCGNQSNSCYEDKYLQLLRVRSPFY